ncbi:PREDICTED: uncharacterized protein LOC103331129 [Prunus mume]|uniref:Uncharacterized protein LOC103331129 n=1 Tax=Prunus mume TaxID=102107 RepID=A0ABM1LQL6_PRUMU|nr:PREDICTED: uncharacterized protein LOC103331129 [Prunus mume]
MDRSSTTWRSRGFDFDFDFVTFNNEKDIRDVIEGMNDQNLDSRNITVSEAQSCGSGSGGKEVIAPKVEAEDVVAGIRFTNCSKVQFAMNPYHCSAQQLFCLNFQFGEQPWYHCKV